MTVDEKLDLIILMLQGGIVSKKKAAVSGDVAGDDDLDGKYGNPQVHRDPPRWDGPSHVGRRYSECSAEYLETLASFLEWRAGKNREKATPEGDKYAGYDAKDAARARGWAARRNGHQNGGAALKTNILAAWPSSVGSTHVKSVR